MCYLIIYYISCIINYVLNEYKRFPSDEGHEEFHGHGGVHGVHGLLYDHLLALLQRSTD